MAPWIIPALKAVLPHVGTIVSATKPMFSKPRPTDDDPELQKQIAELQAVAAQNDTHIRELAGQLQSTVTALEQAAAQAATQARRMVTLCWAALGVSVAAIGIAIAALLAA
jgi:hypothetical protein